MHNWIGIADTLRLECLKQFRLLWWFWWTLEGEISKPRAEAGRQICWAVHLLLLLHSDSLWWNHYIVNEKQRCPLLGMCTHGWLSFVMYFLPRFMYVAMSETLFHFKFRVWNCGAMMKVPLCSTTFHLHIPPAWLRLQMVWCTGVICFLPFSGRRPSRFVGTFRAGATGKTAVCWSEAWLSKVLRPSMQRWGPRFKTTWPIPTTTPMAPWPVGHWAMGDPTGNIWWRWDRLDGPRMCL